MQQQKLIFPIRLSPTLYHKPFLLKQCLPYFLFRLWMPDANQNQLSIKIEIIERVKYIIRKHVDSKSKLSWNFIQENALMSICL